MKKKAVGGGYATWEELRADMRCVSRGLGWRAARLCVSAGGRVVGGCQVGSQPARVAKSGVSLSHPPTTTLPLAPPAA